MTDQDWVEWFKEQILNDGIKVGVMNETNGDQYVWAIECEPGQEDMEAAAYEWIDNKDEFFDELFVLSEQIHHARKKTLEKFDVFLSARQKPPRGQTPLITRCDPFGNPE